MSYFGIIDSPDRQWPSFNGRPTPCSHTPGYFDVLDELKMSAEEFVERANKLFDECEITVPNGYPKLKISNLKFFPNTLEVDPMDYFAICVGNCIKIRDEFNIDVKKIIKQELIDPNSRAGILHACSMASIALHYLKKGLFVEIPIEQKDQSNPDLIIDNFKCEIKVIDESDWTRDLDTTTGQGKRRKLSEDLCFDIGQFISKRDSGHKGIKQADIVFADLSLKSFGWIEKMTNIVKSGFPDLKKCRVVYFTKMITRFSSFYLDFDPDLWDLIKTTNAKHSFGIFPRPKKNKS